MVYILQKGIRDKQLLFKDTLVNGPPEGQPLFSTMNLIDVSWNLLGSVTPGGYVVVKFRNLVGSQGHGMNFPWGTLVSVNPPENIEELRDTSVPIVLPENPDRLHPNSKP